MNKGKQMLALSECCDALSIAKEQMQRAANQLAAISVSNVNSPSDPDSEAAARLVAGVSKFISPLLVEVQRRHDQMCHEFTQEWRS